MRAEAIRVNVWLDVPPRPFGMLDWHGRPGEAPSRQATLSVVPVPQIPAGPPSGLRLSYTGLKVDVTTLQGAVLVFAILALLVACLGKVIGGGLGARLGGLPRWEALGVGFGLNARGAMELVIAAVGLSIGILNDAGYATIVLIAIVTTVMAAPLLQLCVRRAEREAAAVDEPGEEPEAVPA